MFKMEANLEGKSTPVYDVLRCIGFGSYGSVFEARDLLNNRIVALKRIEKNPRCPFTNKPLPFGPSREYLALLKLRDCENVVKILDFFHTMLEDRLIQNFVMEFVPNNLANIINLNRGCLPEKAIKHFAFQIFKGVASIHEKGRSHIQIQILLSCCS